MSKAIKAPFLSTSFSENEKNVKRRFNNILDRNKKGTGKLVLASIFVLLGITGSLVSCSNQHASGDFTPSSLQKLMGHPKADVIKTLQINKKNATVQQDHDSEQYSVDLQLENEEYTVSTNFYNDILMGYQYQFNNRESAYNCAEEVREILEKEYGEPTTYPIDSPDKIRFDSISSNSDIISAESGTMFYEDFTTEKEDTSVRMQVSCFPNGNTFVIIRYVGVFHGMTKSNFIRLDISPTIGEMPLAKFDFVNMI